jgi:hypothetical protein
MYRDKTRRKLETPEVAATGTDGRAGAVSSRGSGGSDVSEVDLQRAGFGVL